MDFSGEPFALGQRTFLTAQLCQFAPGTLEFFDQHGPLTALANDAADIGAKEYRKGQSQHAADADSDHGRNVDAAVRQLRARVHQYQAEDCHDGGAQAQQREAMRYENEQQKGRTGEKKTSCREYSKCPQQLNPARPSTAAPGSGRPT